MLILATNLFCFPVANNFGTFQIFRPTTIFSCETRGLVGKTDQLLESPLILGSGSPQALPVTSEHEKGDSGALAFLLRRSIGWLSNGSLIYLLLLLGIKACLLLSRSGQRFTKNVRRNYGENVKLNLPYAFLTGKQLFTGVFDQKPIATWIIASERMCPCSRAARRRTVLQYF